MLTLLNCFVTVQWDNDDRNNVQVAPKVNTFKEGLVQRDLGLVGPNKYNSYLKGVSYK